MAALQVLHTEWSLGWGGQEIRIMAEMQAFRARGVHMELACRAGSKIAEQARQAGFAVHLLPFAGRADLRTIAALRTLLQSRPFDLIHTHSSIDSWLGGFAGKWAGVPVVRSRHLSSEVKPGLNARLIYNWLPDAVISSGRHIRDHLVNVCGCEARKHFSVPAGADHTRFNPLVDASAVQQQFGLRDDDEVVGIVAVLRSWKGHRVLLEACAKLLPTHPKLKLLLVGDGPIREQIVSWIAELGLGERAILAGHRTDVPECMKAMQVCVLPSLKNEATSQVMPQAMLVGTPVIASTAGGLTEVVVDGVTGRSCEPGDASGLAAALEATLTRREETGRLATQALAHALEELTFERQIARTHDAYRFCLDGR